MRATLRAHAIIALSLDRRPALTLQLPSTWRAMAPDLAGSYADMGFSQVHLITT